VQRTWRSAIREDVDQAIMLSMSFQACIRSLKEKGYEVVTGGKYMKVRPQGKERFVRLRSLGDNYTEEAIKQRILRQRMPEQPPKPAPLTVKRVKVRGDLDSPASHGRDSAHYTSTIYISFEKRSVSQQARCLIYCAKTCG